MKTGEGSEGTVSCILHLLTRCMLRQRVMHVTFCTIGVHVLVRITNGHFPTSTAHGFLVLWSVLISPLCDTGMYKYYSHINMVMISKIGWYHSKTNLFLVKTCPVPWAEWFDSWQKPQFLSQAPTALDLCLSPASNIPRWNQRLLLLRRSVCSIKLTCHTLCCR